MSTHIQGACGSSVLLEHVRSYCELGWRVIPAIGKRPTLKRWPAVASSDYAHVCRWFTGNQNIGVVTGKESGIVVLDIDPRNGGELAFKKLEKELGELPDTVTAQTGGDGWHYVFQWFDGANKKTPANGVDFLAEGSFFVATPSLHPDSKKPYAWLRSPLSTPVAILPEAWRNHFNGVDSPAGDNSEPITQGQRNSTLFQLGCKWRKGGISKQKLITRLHETNINRCTPRLIDDEVNGIVEQCLKYASGKQSLLTRWQNAILSNATLKPYEKMVLLGLGSFADQNGGSCYPNREHIAERTIINVKTVGRCLAANEGRWFARYKRGIEGRGWSYGYQLHLLDEN